MSKTAARSAMTFRVGPWVYAVHISSDQLHDDAGNIADGLCCWTQRQIWLGQYLGSEQRLGVLFHELGHAWSEHFGNPVDPEGIASRLSSFAVDVWRQLDRQGGIDRLSQMAPAKQLAKGRVS